MKESDAKAGIIIKSKVPLKCRYFNYPVGDNLKGYKTGTLFKVMARYPNVRKAKGDSNYFLLLRPVDKEGKFVRKNTTMGQVNATPNQVEKI